MSNDARESHMSDDAKLGNLPEWKLQDAKNRFSAVVDAALGGEPQRVTRRGKPAVVVLSCEAYDRLKKMENKRFVEMLLAIPQGGPDDLFEREPFEERDIEF